MRRAWLMGAVVAGTLAGTLWSESPSTTPTSTQAATRAGTATQAATQASTQPGGVISRRELDKVSWASVMDPPAPEGALIFPDAKAAVWFDKKQFTPDEPLKTWLGVKSMAMQPERGMSLEMDLGVVGSKPRILGGARLQLHKLKVDGTSDVVAEIRGDPNRTVRRVQVPPDGCYVSCGDLRNMMDGPMAPGNYLLKFWAQGQRAEASFSVVVPPGVATTSTAPAARPAAAPDSVLFQWTGNWEGLRKKRALTLVNKFKLENGWLSTRAADDFAKGIALGVGDGPDARHYVRMSDIPQQDDLVQISARYISGAKDRVEITLKPVSGAASQPAESRFLPIFPQVYLLVENMGPTARWSIDSDRYPVIPEKTRVAFNAPVVLDVELPEGWLQRTSFTKQVRLTAVVTSDPVKYGIEPRYPNRVNDGIYSTDPDGRTELRKNQPKNEGKRWTGAVKSQPMDVPVKGQ